MNLRFINRNQERSYLINEIEELDTTKFIIIRGKSGVGKSKLTKVVLEKIDKTPYVKVSFNQRNIIGYDEGSYLRKIGEELDTISDGFNEIKSFKQYLKGLKSKALNYRLLNAVIDDASNLIPGIKTVKEILSKSLSIDNYSDFISFSSQMSENMIVVEDYITQQFAESKIILNIENIQSIDEYSFTTINKISKKCKNLLCIYEYTEGSDYGYDFEGIINEVEIINDNIEVIEIKPLNIKDVKKIIKQNPSVSWEIFENSIVKWNGNLRPIIDVFSLIKYDKNFKKKTKKTNFNIPLSKSTINHLNSLTKTQLFLLIIIDVHKDPIDTSLISFINDFDKNLFFNEDSNEILNQLEKRELIKFDRNKIIIYHDSISKSLNEVRNFERFKLLAFNYWHKTYSDFTLNNNLFITNSRRLEKILFFLVMLKREKDIYSLLEDIEKEAIKSRSPKRMINYVLMAKEQILLSKKEIDFKRKIVDEIELWIVQLFHKIGQPNSALQYIDEFYLDSNSSLILKCISLIDIGKQSEALIIANKLLKKDSKKSSISFELSIKLIKLLCYKGLDLAKKKEKLFYSLIKNKSYYNLLEYGFLLRNSELIFSHEDCIPYLKKSIKVFKKFNAYRQEGYSRNSLAFHLARCGKLKTALKQLDKADKILMNENSERHTLLNNRAAIMLYDYSDNLEIEELLRLALLSAVADFDKITINSNILVLAGRKKDSKLAESSIQNINALSESPSFLDKEIFRQVFYNIHNHYIKNNSLKKAKHYLIKIESLDLPKNNLWKFRLDKLSSDGIKNNFETKFDESIAFLSHWHIDFDIRLMNY